MPNYALEISVCIWEILIFPRTAGNTGNSRELLGNKSLSNQKILNYNRHNYMYIWKAKN